MKDQSILQFCRYYHGEKEPPKTLNQDDTIFWNIEEAWVRLMREDKNDSLTSMLGDYIDAGLSRFDQTDDTPVTLKALLFNRFEQWNEGGGFEEWYRTKYQKT